MTKKAPEDRYDCRIVVALTRDHLELIDRFAAYMRETVRLGDFNRSDAVRTLTLRALDGISQQLQAKPKPQTDEKGGDA